MEFSPYISRLISISHFYLQEHMVVTLSGSMSNVFNTPLHHLAGQPKRHLLTTGWSVFVSAKRLVAGDSVLFIR